MLREYRILQYLFIALMGTLVFYSCKEDTCEVCDQCCSQADSKIVKYGLNQDTVLVFYNAFTPKYYAICDSLEYDTLSNLGWVPPYKANGEDPSKLCTIEEAKEYISLGVTDKCPCREHDQKDYNDDYNDRFVVDGLTEYFPCNRLSIKVPGDTTVIFSENSYNNSSFAGVVTIDSTVIGGPYGKAPIEKMLQSGLYEYELILYADSACQIRPSASPVGFPSFDTLRGHFCIVRNDVTTTGCKGKEEDPLLQ